MEPFIIIVAAIILLQTTYLTIKTTNPKLSYKKQLPVFVDTSVLIDGRITAVARSGFLTAPLFIPRTVIGELQLLADTADPEKRSRARHGLDIVNELQAIPGLDIRLHQDGEKAVHGVDAQLLVLAKKYHGAICTIDFNLNKVAQVEGIPVLNVNDLAKTLRMAYLPGEKMLLELTQKGNDSHQAIGHLVDGTMVVVEQAVSLIGKTVEIEVIRSLQTAAGKMMFARLTKPVQRKKQDEPKADKPAKQVKGRAPAKQKQPQQKRARRTPEDSMVELANKN